MRVLEEEEFLAWKRDPATQAVMELLARKREELRQQWESGAFTDWTQEGMALVNVGNIGTCKGYAFLMELDYEGYLTEVSDDRKQVGVETPRSRGAD